MTKTAFRAALAAIACIGIGLSGGGPALAQSTGPATMPNGARVPGANSAPGQGTDAPRAATPEVGSSTPVGTPAAPAEIIDRPVTPSTSAASPRSRSPASAGPSSTQPPATTQAGPSRAQSRDAARTRPATGAPLNSSQADAAAAANDFPPGIADCARKADRDERASCASKLYGSPSGAR